MFMLFFALSGARHLLPNQSLLATNYSILLGQVKYQYICISFGPVSSKLGNINTLLYYFKHYTVTE